MVEIFHKNENGTFTFVLVGVLRLSSTRRKFDMLVMGILKAIKGCGW